MSHLLAAKDLRSLSQHRKGGSPIAQAERRNWLLAMRRYLDLSVALSNTKSNMLVDSALLERIQMATMKRERPVSPASVFPIREMPGESVDDIPWNVSQASKFLRVSPQTIYLWVERKQIPHLRVMGRNIRFLRADLERFRATFRRELEGSHGISR